MVVDRLRTESFHQTVKTFCRHPFKFRIRIALLPHSIYDITAVKICVHHLFHCRNIILSITIHGDDGICILLRLHHPGKDRVLMTPVPALAYSKTSFVTLCQPKNQTPGPIPTPVIHKKDPAPPVDLPGTNHPLQFPQKQGNRNRKDFLFVIAGEHKIQDWWFSCVFCFSHAACSPPYSLSI